MRELGGLCGSLFGFALIGLVIYVVTQHGPNKVAGRGGFGVRRADIRAYAKRYLKRFPDTKPKRLRESLRQEFLPERIGKPESGGLFGGLGGMLGTAAAVHLSDSEIDRIKELIDEVIEGLYPEDES